MNIFIHDKLVLLMYQTDINTFINDKLVMLLHQFIMN